MGQYYNKTIAIKLTRSFAVPRLEVSPCTLHSCAIQHPADQREHTDVAILGRGAIAPEMDHLDCGVPFQQPRHNRIDDGYDSTRVVAPVVGHQAQTNGDEVAIGVPQMDHGRMYSDRIFGVVGRLHFLGKGHQPILCEIHLDCASNQRLQALALISHSLVLVGRQLDVDFDVGECCDQSLHELVLRYLGGDGLQLLYHLLHDLPGLLENKRTNRQTN